MNSIISNFIGGGNTGKDNIETIDGINYIFNFNLYNGITKVGLKFAAIDQLNIVDDLKYFYCYGSVTFNYNNDVLEAFESLGEATPGGNNKVFEPYVFRGDGRDLILVEIMPQIKEQECLEFTASEGERERYMIKHTFSIYHIEDKTDGAGMKRRTLYFWDRDFQVMNNISVDFSTADLLTASVSPTTINVNSADVDVSNSTQNNSVMTGDAIKGFLNLVLGTEFRIPVKFGDWDTGSTRINYSTPAQHKAIDDLDYLLTYHVSTDDNYNLPCILKKQRYTEKYRLIPLNKWYSGGSGGFSLLSSLFGGGKVSEDFYIGKAGASGETDLFASAFSLKGSKENLKDFNLIDNYKFTKISATELQKYFTTYAVHTNDPRGYFSADLKENSYLKVKEMYRKIFLEPMGQSFSNLPDNVIREVSKNSQHVFVPYAMEQKQRKNFGVNRSMLNLFFKNTNIQFNVRGNTSRKTGNFFTVNRRDGASQRTHDSNVLGQYLITYLRHEFKAGTYTNTIMGTKPYAGEDPKFAKPL
jgi:hypothetical protein